MKCKLFIALLSALLFVQAAPGPRASHETATAIEFFEGSFEDALKVAKAKDKLVFMDAYATWCGPCRILERQVFTDPAVGDFFNEHFINVRVDMEKGEGRGLAGKYEVNAYPTLLFLNADGTIINKTVGFRNSGQLIALGNEVLGH